MESVIIMKTGKKIFTIEIEQTVRKTYEIAAKSENQAKEIAEQMWEEINVNEVDGWDCVSTTVIATDDKPSELDLQNVNN